MTCTFTNRKVDGRAIVVKAGNEWAYHDDTLTFSFTVNNSGASPLTNVAVRDDRCTSVTLSQKRDAAGNPDPTPNVLDLTDTWVYECSMPAPAHAAGEANPIVNTATVTAVDEFQRDVSDTDQHSTLLLHPVIAIDKTGPATAQAGQPVPYTLVVTNPGDVPFAAANVNVSDALCEAPPNLTTKNGDGSPGQLDPGDAWTYTCTVQTLVRQTAVDNVASVTGTDSFGGRDVTASDPASTQLTQPAVAGTSAVRGSSEPVRSLGAPRTIALLATGTARLSGPRRCVTRPFMAKVTGRGIARVSFLHDGRRVRTVRATGGRTEFRMRITPRRPRNRAHRVTARVTFAASANTPARTLRFSYLGCARGATAPHFTG